MIFLTFLTLLLVPICMFILIYIMAINFVFCVHIQHNVQNKKIINDTQFNSHHIFIKYIL